MYSSFTQTVNGEPTYLTIGPVAPDRIDDLRAQAAKERIRFTDKTEMYALTDQSDTILGFCGIDFQHSKAVFKNDYVLPEYRGNGLWGRMFSYRKLVALNHGSKLIEANCTDMSVNLYKRAGAQVITEYTDLTKVRIYL